MNIWNNIIKRNIIKIIFYNFSKNKNQEWLFIGNINKNIKDIIDNLNNLGTNFKNLNLKDKNLLKEIYGENIEKELKEKLLIDTEIIYKDIHYDDSILDLKKKIFIYLSDNNNSFNINNQYLWIENNINKDFFIEIINNLFNNNKILSSNKISLLLNKLLNDKIKLKKKNIIIMI